MTDDASIQVELLAPHGRITLVGDDDQSIFGFNGSCNSNFDAFRRRWTSEGLVEVIDERLNKTSLILKIFCGRPFAACLLCTI